MDMRLEAGGRICHTGLLPIGYSIVSHSAMPNYTKCKFCIVEGTKANPRALVESLLYLSGILLVIRIP